MKKQLLMAVLGLVAGKALSQDTNALDPVTVVGTIKPIKASQTGRNIFVLQASEIAKLPVKSLDELFRYIPGIEMQSRGAMGAQSDITIRGGTFQQVLVIVDGIRLNDPNTGHFSAYIPVQPEEIEKIEVLKGTSSVLYGSDAVGGVINITTKTFANNQTKNTQWKGAVAGGQFGLINANIAKLFTSKNTSYQLAAQTNNMDGETLRGIQSYVHNHTAAASINHKMGYWNLAFRTSYDHRDFAAQNYYTNFVSDTSVEKVSIFWNQLNIGYKKNKNQWNILAGFKNTEDNFKFNNISTANSSFSNLYQASVLYSHQYNTQTFITTGVQYVGRNIRSNDRGKHTVNQLGGFATLQSSLGKYLHYNAGIRYDYNEIIGGYVVPQLNLAYTTNAMQLRGSIGSSFRYADFTEQYNNYGKPLVTSGRIGNENLGAEKALNYELGLDVFANKKTLKFSVDVFQRNYKDLIDWAATSYTDMPRKDNLVPTGSYLLARNVAGVLTSGAELNVLYNKTWAKNNNVYASAGLLWLDSKSTDGTMTLYISAHARLLSNFSIRYASKQWGFGLNGIYKTRAEQAGTATIQGVDKSYFVANLKVDKTIVANKLTGFVQIDNLFNKSYNDFLGTPMPSRTIFAGLRCSL